MSLFIYVTFLTALAPFNSSPGRPKEFCRVNALIKFLRVRVGMEATGYSRWFERLLAELGIEIWMGDPAEIKVKRVKKRKTARNDALLLLRLMRENNFPQVWGPSPENRDVRQLLWHRHRLVQMRTWIMYQLQALAMNEGYRWKKKLFGEQGRAQLEKQSNHRFAKALAHRGFPQVGARPGRWWYFPSLSNHPPPNIFMW